jgi:uncharacterized protein (TIGR00725 family)
VAVCGPGRATHQEEAWAQEVGRRLAETGAVVLCGGLGGVMDAVARGVRDGAGIVIGVLPGETRAGASEHLTAAIPSGMGEARNAIIARAADVVVAIGGEWGTLSEIALARKMGTPVIGLGTWELGRRTDEVTRVDTPEDAVREALSAAEVRRS